MIPKPTFKYGAELTTPPEYLDRLWAFNTVCAHRLKDVGRIVHLEIRPCETVRATWYFADGTRATWSNAGFVTHSDNPLRDKAAEVISYTLAQHHRVKLAANLTAEYRSDTAPENAPRITLGDWVFYWTEGYRGVKRGVLENPKGCPGRAWYELSLTNGTHDTVGLRELLVLNERPTLYEDLCAAVREYDLMAELWPTTAAPVPEPAPEPAPDPAPEVSDSTTLLAELFEEAPAVDAAPPKTRPPRRWRGRIGDEYAANWVARNALHYADENYNGEHTEWTIYLSTTADPAKDWIDVRLICHAGAMHKGSYHLAYNVVQLRFANRKDAMLLSKSRPGLHAELLELLKDLRKW